MVSFLAKSSKLSNLSASFPRQNGVSWRESGGGVPQIVSS